MFFLKCIVCFLPSFHFYIIGFPSQIPTPMKMLALLQMNGNPFPLITRFMYSQFTLYVCTLFDPHTLFILYIYTHFYLRLIHDMPSFNAVNPISRCRVRKCERLISIDGFLLCTNFVVCPVCVRLFFLPCFYIMPSWF